MSLFTWKPIGDILKNVQAALFLTIKTLIVTYAVKLQKDMKYHKTLPIQQDLCDIF